MTDNTFKKSYRLLSARDFSYLKNNTKTRQSRWLRIYYKVASENRININTHSRIGLAVSKKVGNACLRALVKRTLREAFRRSDYKELSVDFVVTVSPTLFKKKKRREAIKLLRESFLSILPRLSMVQD